MKAKILNLLSYKEMGGIKTSLDSLTNSRLTDRYEFAIAMFKDATASIRNWQPDIIIVHDACNWEKLPDLLKLKFFKGKAQLLLLEHHYAAGFERTRVPKPNRFRLMLKICYWCFDRVVANSYGQARWMDEHQLVAPHKLNVIQQSLDCERFLAVPSKPRSRPLIFAAYGRFDRLKGFDILIRAVNLIPHIDFQLQIGGYGDDEESLKELAAQNAQTSSKIRFVGTVLDVPEFLSNCDVVIVPSRADTWGNVCLEARAAGKPIIASAIDGLVEQVQECGILVEPENPQDLAKAIAEVCELPPEQLSRFGCKARESAIGAWDKHLTDWEGLLCQLLEN